ncbi:MAG: hypothetical protein EBS25_06550 [Actinobacteria bacterium]|nr:hypothetical protein [Actinomycetota bacterium]
MGRSFEKMTTCRLMDQTLSGWWREEVSLLWQHERAWNKTGADRIRKQMLRTMGIKNRLKGTSKNQFLAVALST